MRRHSLTVRQWDIVVCWIERVATGHSDQHVITGPIKFALTPKMQFNRAAIVAQMRADHVKHSLAHSILIKFEITILEEIRGAANVYTEGCDHVFFSNTHAYHRHVSCIFYPVGRVAKQVREMSLWL